MTNAQSPHSAPLHPRDIPWCQEHSRAMVQRDGRGWYCPTVLLSEKSRSGSRAEKVAGGALPCCDDGPSGHTQQQHHDASPCYDPACKLDHPHGGPYCPGDSLGDHGPRCDCPDADGPSW